LPVIQAVVWDAIGEVAQTAPNTDQDIENDLETLALHIDELS
jgi:hypothetical protein